MSPDTHAILQSHGLTQLAVLQQNKTKLIIVAQDKEKNKFVVKVFTTVNRFLLKEIDFLEMVSGTHFRYLLFPKLESKGENYFITRYVDREQHTRDSILARQWTTENYRLFVRGITEFQEIRRHKKYFTFTERIKGFFFPALMVMKNYGWIAGKLSMTQKWTLFRLAIFNLAGSFFWKKVLVHYDFQTTNYAFAVPGRQEEQKMSVLDMETGSYKGDAWYDLLYYCSIPVVSLYDWTFQKELFREFIKIANPGGRGYLLVAHVRSVLLAVQLIRYSNFKNDASRQEIYFRNIGDILLNTSKFNAWFIEMRA
ncbi:MAG: hypothetical protein ABI763_13910 [Bacteroidota bacterium]